MWQGEVDLERDIKELSRKVEMLCFDKNTFYTLNLFVKTHQTIHLRFVCSKVYQFYHTKKVLNIELLLVGLVFLDGIWLAILKLLTLYSRIVQLSKYIEGARFLLGKEGTLGDRRRLDCVIVLDSNWQCPY